MLVQRQFPRIIIHRAKFRSKLSVTTTIPKCGSSRNQPALSVVASIDFLQLDAKIQNNQTTKQTLAELSTQICDKGSSHPLIPKTRRIARTVASVHDGSPASREARAPR